VISLSEINPSLINRRRLIFWCVTSFLLGLATALMITLLSQRDWTALQTILLILFVLLILARIRVEERALGLRPE